MALFTPKEEELQLFGNVSDKKILEMGCGSGHSLKHLAEHRAEECWGLDLSSSQINTAKQLLNDHNIKAHLFISAMENNPGIPVNYFDVVFSIFALGWTTDLRKTLNNVHNYLNDDGIFIFSWEHPLYSTLKFNNDRYIVNRSYLQEGSYKKESWRGVPIVMHHRKISTFINELVQSGFSIERIVEEYRSDSSIIDDNPNNWYCSQRAKSIPATIIFKCRKI